MALSSRLEHLQSKHAQLDMKIQHELKHPIPDTLRLSQMKKKSFASKSNYGKYARHSPLTLCFEPAAQLCVTAQKF